MRLSIIAMFCLTLLAQLVSGEPAKFGNPEWIRPYYSDLAREVREQTWFEQVLDRLAEYWHPTNFTGKLVILFSMNGFGKITDASVLQSSGIAQQDEQALLAVKKTIFPLTPGDELILREHPKGKAEYRTGGPLPLDREAAQKCLQIYQRKFSPSAQLRVHEPDSSSTANHDTSGEVTEIQTGPSSAPPAAKQTDAK